MADKTTSAATGMTAGAAIGSIAGPIGMAVGMGAGLFGAFAGDEGYTPSASVKMNKLDRKLRKETFDTSMADYAKASRGDIYNLAYPYIQQLKEAEGVRSRTALSELNASSLTKSSLGTPVSGGREVSEIMSNAGERTQGVAAPEIYQGSVRREEYLNALGDFKNMYNIEKQSGALSIQSQAARQGNAIYNQAAQGQAVGDLFQMGGMLSLAKAKGYF